MPGPPEPPGTPVLSNVKLTTITVTWGPPSDNHGSAVNNYRLNYWASGVAVKSSDGNSRTRNLTGLIPGYEYFFVAYAHNAYGWSTPSPTQHGTMFSGVRIRYAGKWHIAVPYIRYSGAWHEAIPYVRYSGGWHGTRP